MTDEGGAAMRTAYRAVKIDGLSIFYREAGPRDALWTDEYAYLTRPGQADIQTDLFYDYRTNVEVYPRWQAWMRERQPRLLVLWGKYDPSFDISEPEAYRRDVPGGQVHLLDAGHFALDTAADEIAAPIRSFVADGGHGLP